MLSRFYRFTLKLEILSKVQNYDFRHVHLTRNRKFLRARLIIYSIIFNRSTLIVFQYNFFSEDGKKASMKEILTKKSSYVQRTCTCIIWTI